MHNLGNSTCNIEQCLKDMGCDMSLSQKFLSESTSQRLILLKRHRKTLIDNMHENQRKIDCVDYVINKIKSDSLCSEECGK